MCEPRDYDIWGSSLGEYGKNIIGLFGSYTNFGKHNVIDGQQRLATLSMHELKICKRIVLIYKQAKFIIIGLGDVL